MSVLRAFIAIELSSEISHRIDQISAELKKRVPANAVRWVAARNIHLTLKFLGDVSSTHLDPLQKMIQVECINYAPFDISVGNLGAFPSMRRPRVIWIGLTATETLPALQQSIELGASHIGYPPEDRPFSPHLTLGRLARNADPAELQQVGQVLSGYNIGFLGAMRVEAVHLIRSDLSPSGARYTRLYSASLREAR